MGVLLWTLFVPGKLPPAGMESSQFFHFLPAVGLLTLVAALTVTVGRGRPLRFRLGDGAVVALGLYALARAGVGEGRTLPLIGMWGIGLLVVLYLDLRLCLRIDRRRMVGGIVLLLLVAGVAQEVVGFRQLYGYDLSNHARFRITGTFHNPAPLGGFLALVLGLALDRVGRLYRPVVRLVGRRGWGRSLLTVRVWTFGLSCLFVFGALLLLPATQSRIAWLGAMAAVAIVGWDAVIRPFGRWLVRRRWRLFVLIPCGLLVAGLAAVAAYRMKAQSADGRLLMWKTTARMVADRPLTGVGLGCFAGVYGEYQADYLASEGASEGERQVAGCAGAAFNDYLQLAAELGVPGLLLLLFLLVWAFRGFRRQWRAEGRGFAAALAALSIVAVASYPLQLLSFRILWVVWVAVGLSELYGGRSVAKAGAGDRIGSRLVACSCLIVCGLALWRAWPLRRAYGSWGALFPLYRMERFETVADDYDRLAPALEGEPSFLFEWANVRNKVGDYDRSIAILERALRLSSDPMLYNLLGHNYRAKQDYEAAETAYLRAWAVVPNRIYPLYLLTDLYRETGRTERMRVVGRRVLEFDEKVPSPAVREIKARVRKWLE